MVWARLQISPKPGVGRPQNFEGKRKKFAFEFTFEVGIGGLELQTSGNRDTHGNSVETKNPPLETPCSTA
jgi:hypothetical protein